MNTATGPRAPQLQVSQWLNSKEPVTLAALRGKVVVIEAFQMLCPGCVHHGIPQVQRIAAYFNPAQVTVLGLHTVFENHEVMGPAALKVFVHENRLGFPIGIDQPQGHGLPLTMQAYGMQGTPTLLVIDRAGRLRHQEFGQVSDLSIGAAIGSLIAEPLDATGMS